MYAYGIKIQIHIKKIQKLSLENGEFKIGKVFIEVDTTLAK